MALEIPAILGNPIFLGIVFILFVLAIKRVTKILMNCVWITVAAVIFPIIANKILNMPVPIDADSIIFFITIGIGGYFVFLLASSIYKMLTFAEKEAGPVTGFLGNAYRGVSGRLRERMAKSKLEKIEKDREKAALKKEREEQNELKKEKLIEEEKKRADQSRISEIHARA